MLKAQYMFFHVCCWNRNEFSWVVENRSKLKHIGNYGIILRQSIQKNYQERKEVVYE